jgi:hypothetical protein
MEVQMAEFMMGVCAPGDPSEAGLMKQAGIEWVRLGCQVPFVDRIGGALSEPYKRTRAHYEEWAAEGIKVMGVTPGPGVKRWEPGPGGKLELVWHRGLPEWFGQLGTAPCLKAYEETCAWLAGDLRELVQAWQIGNELDWHQFAGPMSARQACDFILAGARGLKRSDPSLIIGHNPTTEKLAYFFYGRLFAEGLLDYCGIDRYFGSWQPGGPEDWLPLIAELHELTLAPVLINEWGFASAGGVMTAQDRASGAITCACRRWPHTWGPGHTPEGQAEFIRLAFDAFIARKAQLLGQFYFRWADQRTCWQCGQPACPAETAWGLVDLEGKPKPSYHALEDGVRRLREA